jgi:hypothetical protein
MHGRLSRGALAAIVVVATCTVHASAVVTANIHIGSSSAGTSIDTQLLTGTNLPAWIGPQFQDPTLIARTAAGSVGVIRIPGGSWSDDYGWLSCEMGANQPGAYPCGQGWQTWAAKPTDFVNFLRAIGKSGDQVMYTMNVNVTAQEAAAAVAFFNALPSDATPIGTDSHGTDWHTAGYWAQLRADHGNPIPLGIKYWELGNEIYGGTPANGGTDCVAWGWENSWTCDGTEYVNGIGSGATRHAGYLEFRTAMRAVDPTILLGAVGTEDPADYANWGNEVIAAAGSVMDFYVVHPYAYYIPPPNTALGRAQILAQPQTHWHDLKTALQAAFDTYAGGRQIPIAATEYNLVSVQDQDTKQLMTRAVNALFVADSIGQALVNGFAMANQWDLSNGCASNHTCYDLLQIDHTFRRAPQYYAFPLWARFGSTSLPVTLDLDPATQLSVYAGRIDTSTLSLLAINKTGRTITGLISFDDGASVSAGSADVARAGSLAAKAMSFNNRRNPANDLSNAPALPLRSVGATVTYSFRPSSITLLRMTIGP